ncbi:MAG: hypothetical protein A2V99_05325 [Spirochaetes bacterium RBG_16_67_19]|nr:MAG: hypothetical protein A2064_03065 [Spirochaetes bacterium GWB1_66_5]OHD72933.1 MAG: hypothetical protein A2V99_05325 [Spirochaetes bacterium RBG_16_67_19]
MKHMAWLLAAAAVAFAALAACPAAAQAREGGPPGFRGVSLGMGLEQVKERLAADALFGYRGDPDVSLLPTPQQTLIECSGASWVRRAFFQFHEGRLFSIILVLDDRRLDYFTLFDTLSRKYGGSTRLNPTEAVWEFPGLRLSLERPLSVKYLDSGVFSALREQGQAGEALTDASKKMFLEEF